LVERAHHRDHTARGVSRGFERLGIPLHQRSLNLLAFRSAVQHLANRGAVMWKICVQPHEALIARRVDARDGVPGWRRRLAAHAQITLASAFDDRMTHIDDDVLRLATAQLPNLRRRQRRGADASLRRGCQAERGRQLRLLSPVGAAEQVCP